MSEKKPLPTFRVSAEQYKTIFGLCAALRQFGKAESDLFKRIEVIPNGKRDLHLILSVGRKLVQNITDTIPEDKRESVKRQSKHTTFDILIRPRMNLLEKYEIVVDTKEMNTALYYAHEQCKFCIEGKCDRCKLGKTLDRLMTYDREGKSWADIDLECMNQ